MKHYFFPALKALCITVGLNGALLGYIALFTLLVEEPVFQALLFFCIVICPAVAVCLFANIHAEKRRTLWLCAAVSLPLHVFLSIGSMLLYGFIMASVWSSDLAPILVMLMAVVPWVVAVLAITVIRSWGIGRKKREAKRQLRRISKGFSRITLPVSPARSGFAAVCRGILWAVWLHLSTGLLFVLLQKTGIAETMLSYVAFPVLWCLAAAAYGLFDRPRRLAFTLSAGISHLILTLFCGVWLTAVYSVRLEDFYMSSSSLLASLFYSPFQYAEGLITVTVFCIGIIAITVFSIGHKPRKD